MIGYLRGQLLENQEGKMIVLVGEGGAVGYTVTVPQSAAYDLLPSGKTVELHIYTHVREESLDLYGFRTKPEKELFLTLLGVNGIGPKVAMGILSKVDPGTLIQAVIDGDRAMLTGVPGIGKKTAERVVLELADPLRKKVEAGGLTELMPAAKAPSSKGKQMGLGAMSAGAVYNDAKQALMGLGYRENEVTALLNRVLEERGSPPARADDLIRSALQRLG
jgi:Holliday junction DNA helicase RuvA